MGYGLHSGPALGVGISLLLVGSKGPGKGAYSMYTPCEAQGPRWICPQSRLMCLCPERSHVHVSRDWGNIRRGSRAQADKELTLGREVCIAHASNKGVRKAGSPASHLSITSCLSLLVHEFRSSAHMEPIGLRSNDRIPYVDLRCRSDHVVHFICLLHMCLHSYTC
jgi:hypothetical protein